MVEFSTSIHPSHHVVVYPSERAAAARRKATCIVGAILLGTALCAMIVSVDLPAANHGQGGQRSALAGVAVGRLSGSEGLLGAEGSTIMMRLRGNRDTAVGSSNGQQTSLFIPDMWNPASPNSPTGVSKTFDDLIDNLKKLRKEMACISECSKHHFHLDNTTWDNQSSPWIQHEVVITRYPPAGANVTEITENSTGIGRQIITCVKTCASNHPPIPGWEDDKRIPPAIVSDEGVHADLDALQADLARKAAELTYRLEQIAAAQAVAAALHTEAERRGGRQLHDNAGSSKYSLVPAEMRAAAAKSSSLLVTGTSVDGRRTVPGLGTECVPGSLTNDCTPQQEDGAASAEAGAFLDAKGAVGGASYMLGVQHAINEGYAAKQKFLDGCLTDWTKCNTRRADDDESVASGGRAFAVGDQPRYGARSHPFVPEQASDLGVYDGDAGWDHVSLPSGVDAGGGGLVSGSYYKP